MALTVAASDTLKQNFSNPGFEAKPWTFWYWMFGAVSEEGIKADLTAMKEAGLGGTYLMPIKSVAMGSQYEGKAEQLSPEWWRLVVRSMEIADSLDLKLGMHICDGFALAGGPWITPAESMQKVVVADTLVKGGKVTLSTLPVPESNEGYYEDIAILAIPFKGSVIDINPVITCGNYADDVEDGKGITVDESGAVKSQVPAWFMYDYGKPVTACNVIVQPSGTNHQAHRLTIYASDNGKDFSLVKKLTPARQGWQNTDADNTYSFTPTTARYFRFDWSPVGTEPGSEDLDAAKWKPNLKIKKVTLTGTPKIDNWEGKAGLVWRVAPATPDSELTADLCVKKNEIIDLSYLLAKDAKRKNIRLPKGDWQILRVGHTSTGHVNATAGGGKGLECDKFSREAVAKQFDNWYGRVFRELNPELVKRVLKYMHVDSWECGSQNWSDNFESEFKARRGYDLYPYLPLFAGIPVDDAATSEKVMRDIRTTIAELVVDVFYDVLAQKAKEYDVQFSAECVSPTMVSDGMAHYSMVDIPMGEFWLRSPTHDKPNDMIDAIHGAHVYGKPVIQAEGFTEVRGTWDETPAMLKTLLDRNYALGINRLFFHVTTHNPWLDKKPGMTLDGIGLFFQRDNTWWRDGAKGLVDYAKRCQAMLQYGVPVVDIAVFSGEEIPRRAVLPDRLVSTLPGIFGHERVRTEQKRLANKEQPMRVMPVGVTHSANMADPDKWFNALKGYNYDSMNKDALLRLASTKDGKIVMPGGNSYSVLVLPLPSQLIPDNSLSDETAAKVAELKANGVIVPEIPYLDSDFSSLGIERDLIAPEFVAWNHRRNEEENTDVYFISNQNETPASFTASFRIDGRVPELWNPLDGTISSAEWVRENGRTLVNMDLPSAGSMFVVFSRPTSEKKGKAPEMVNVTFAPSMSEEWSIRFHNTGKEIRTPDLFDWSSSDSDDVKYYSGTATYTNTFEMPANGNGSERVFLNFEGLHDVASVKVNGKDCGIIWTAPYRVDITDAVKGGDNSLSIDVSNTWNNALLGSDLGKAPFKGIWTNGKFRPAEKSALPAGLTKPITLTIKSR